MNYDNEINAKLIEHLYLNIIDIIIKIWINVYFIFQVFQIFKINIYTYIIHNAIKINTNTYYIN